MHQPTHADSKLIWMDGKMVPYDKATVPVLSHSLHYGGAIFEGIRAYKTSDGQTAIFRAKEHFQRFLDSIHTLGYRTEFSIEQFIAASCECIKANDFQECYVRPLAYIDDSYRGLKLPAKPNAHIAIAAWSWGKYMGDAGQAQGIRARISSFRRPDIGSAMTFAKVSGNYLISVMARTEAVQSGCDEAILLDQQGFVAEGSGENLFIVEGEKLITPPKNFILPGITRDTIFQLAKTAHLSIQEENITRNRLYLANEIFFTGTAVEVTGVREVDGHTIGEGKVGPLTKKITDLYFKAVRGELKEFEPWLTFV